MADFYVKYGSRNAKLIGNFSLGKINLKLHQVNSCYFVISKNRKVLATYIDINRAISGFYNAIMFEDPNLFNY